MSGQPEHGSASLGDALGRVESFLLEGEPSLTRLEVCDRAGVPIEEAARLWQLLGFAQTADDAVAFTEVDVDALRMAHELVDLGVLGPDRQAALVRTWGRSYARLAEWQTTLLAAVAIERGLDPASSLGELVEEVLPRVEKLQDYVWRRHLVSAGGRLLAVSDPTSPVVPVSVLFVDIVGYTARSKTLGDDELVAWVEHFESTTTELVTEAGARIIKNIGDEVLVVADDPACALELALRLTGLGEDDDDPFPAVRAGIAHGEVVHRLGDVFGPTVNVAARLTSVARPGTVLVDRGVHDALGEDDERWRWRRVRRLSVKGYTRLAAWSVRGRTDTGRG